MTAHWNRDIFYLYMFVELFFPFFSGFFVSFVKAMHAFLCWFSGCSVMLQPSTLHIIIFITVVSKIERNSKILKIVARKKKK